MKFKWSNYILLLICMGISLQAMQPGGEPAAAAQHQGQHAQRNREKNFAYLSSFAQYMLFTGMFQGKKALLPSLNRFFVCDYLTHALYKLSGVSNRYYKQIISKSVNQIGNGIMAYADCPPKTQQQSFMGFMLKNVIPRVIRSTVIDYVHQSVSDAAGIDYPDSLKRNALFAFFVAPMISQTIKEMVWGNLYDGMSSIIQNL